MPPLNPPIDPGHRRKSKNDAWRCKHCKRRGDEVVSEKNAATGDFKGEHLVHERLCQGLDQDGHPLGLPAICPACNRVIGTRDRKDREPTPKMWMNHWLRCQPAYPLTDNFTLRNILQMFSKYLLPTTDMNAKFGNILSRKVALDDDKHLLHLEQQWKRDELTAAKGADDVISQYRSDFARPLSFRDFFQGAVPLTLEAHVSSVKPQDVVSAIRRLTSHKSVASRSIARLSDAQITASNVAFIQGAYGASVGPLGLTSS
ncbi:uncharacterized protein ColSpa_12807 [Colletotrichum spaethianum]|uniref:Uncharacterized protein n=1 Tax=Colletotrichum spaethianum TaxID=700344 RepID=A0AA37PHV5_9PEZI|nr:uncharacterized protein ColSpa_12807 [Colletotrichum spaethianum]GKT52626.1 hypothetical protein ColSpa_12807 [Colletotrichum spaethianum]